MTITFDQQADLWRAPSGWDSEDYEVEPKLVELSNIE